MARSIVLHPGFAKCATSSIQRHFVIRDHELPRSMGITTLGRNLKPDNGYPDVGKLMYAPADCLADLAANDYPPGRYFLSNEALGGAAPLIRALADRFTIERAVFARPAGHFQLLLQRLDAARPVRIADIPPDRRLRLRSADGEQAARLHRDGPARPALPGRG
jgi:hypothetical protein